MPDNSGISGVVAYDTGGRPTVWLNCGGYDKPVPDEYAGHDLKHGAVWITCQTSLPQAGSASSGCSPGGRACCAPSGGGLAGTFRLSPRYTPEYPGECSGGTGTPAAT